MTTWTNEVPLAGQTSITYNQSGKTYNQLYYQFNGKQRAIFTNQNKN